MWLKVFFRYLAAYLEVYPEVHHANQVHHGVEFKSQSHLDTAGVISVYYRFPEEALMVQMRVEGLKGALRGSYTDVFDFPAAILVGYSLGSVSGIEKVAATVAAWAIKESGLE